jgi:hypothetical protein
MAQRLKIRRHAQKRTRPIMGTFSWFRTSPVALVTSVTIVLPPTVPTGVAAAQTQQAGAPAKAPQTAAPAKAPQTTAPAKAPQTAAPAKTAQAAAPATATDPGWPRTYAVGGGSAIVYQPQIEEWENSKHITAWSAVSYLKSGTEKAALGTIKLEANTEVAVDARMVNFSNLAITESNFSTLSRDDAKTVVTSLQKEVGTGNPVISLDRVLVAVDKSAIRPKDVAGVKADPPVIFASTTPAVLVNLDGNPVWSPIKDNDLEFVVNTNWDIFQHKPTKTFYLRVEKSWMQAPAIEGPWKPAGDLPDSFKKLDSSENWKEVKANVPGKKLSADEAPAVFYSTQPAELILSKGAPVYEAVAGTSLLWVSNTESDLFRLGKTGAFYYLVSGRWFSATSVKGPWTFATPNLPPEFQKIPSEHPRSRVLASIPGTDEATEAVLLASIPQTARVNRKEIKAPEVQYTGDPKYEEIPGTSVSRAVNTDKDIIKVGDLYYMCFQAVWFTSKSPTGPWEVATTVPKEIYSIPASSPSYNVTYVTVEESKDNDDWVTFAYVAGYTGMMVAWGCAVWGTGYYYPPYVGYGYGYYPAYYGYPRSYGGSAWYNPWTGNYGRAVSAYGPYGGATAAAVYNPRTGTYARGAAAYGPYGGRAAAQAYNPRTGAYGQTRQGSNMYGNWGSSSVQRGDDWARTAHTNNYRTGASTKGIQTSNGNGAITRTDNGSRTTVGRDSSGDVYAGRDGNVYKKSGDSWSQWNDGAWQPANGDRPTPQSSQLNRDQAARETGTSRTNSASQYKSSPTTQRAGSYGSGSRSGGARAGGGRRR